MKTFKRTFIAIFAISFCSCILTSCDPDDIDAFAEGYRDGYYGSRAEAGDTTDETPMIDIVDSEN